MTPICSLNERAKGLLHNLACDLGVTPQDIIVFGLISVIIVLGISLVISLIQNTWFNKE